MANTLLPLVVDFLEWIEAGPQPYAAVMDAWRTSCPRLTVWEEAVEHGLVSRRHTAAEGAVVALAPAGRALLDRYRRRESPGRRNAAVQPILTGRRS